MKVMTASKTIVSKTKTIKLMGADKPTHIHINDKANRSSVLVPINDIKKILSEEDWGLVPPTK